MLVHTSGSVKESSWTIWKIKYLSQHKKNQNNKVFSDCAERTQSSVIPSSGRHSWKLCSPVKSVSIYREWECVCDLRKCFIKWANMELYRWKISGIFLSIRLVEKIWKLCCTGLWNVLVAHTNASKPVWYPIWTSLMFSIQ